MTPIKEYRTQKFYELNTAMEKQEYELAERIMKTLETTIANIEAESSLKMFNASPHNIQERRRFMYGLLLRHDLAHVSEG